MRERHISTHSAHIDLARSSEAWDFSKALDQKTEQKTTIFIFSTVVRQFVSKVIRHSKVSELLASCDSKHIVSLGEKVSSGTKKLQQRGTGGTPRELTQVLSCQFRACSKGRISWANNSVSKNKCPKKLARKHFSLHPPLHWMERDDLEKPSRFTRRAAVISHPSSGIDLFGDIRKQPSTT